MHRYNDFLTIVKKLSLPFIHLIKKISYIIYFIYLSRLITKQKVKFTNTLLVYVYQPHTKFNFSPSYRSPD